MVAILQQKIIQNTYKPFLKQLIQTFIEINMMLSLIGN